jgi:hypothetical protein
LEWQPAAFGRGKGCTAFRKGIQIVKKRYSISVFILTCSFLFSLQWPVEDPVLTTSFSSPHRGLLTVGISLDSEMRDVKPYRQGEIIFWASENYGPDENDGVIVLLHDEGFRSCYGRITPNINTEHRSYFKEEDQLGERENPLLFSIRDSRTNLWVNPLFMFTSLNDNINPVIDGVYLETEKERIELTGRQIIPPQSYRLLIDTTDFMVKDGIPLVPYQVKVRYLGRVVYSLSLDSLVSREGILKVEGNPQGESPFTNEGMINGGILGITGGKGFLEVEVIDYRGNKTSKQFPLNQD